MEERKALTVQLQTLKKAYQVLQRDPNIAAVRIDDTDGAYESHIRSVTHPAETQRIKQQPVLQNGTHNKQPAMTSHPVVQEMATPVPSVAPVVPTRADIKHPPTMSAGLFGERKTPLFDKDTVKRTVPANNPLFD